MIDKPKECLGCPFYGDGRGFVPDSIASPTAPVEVCGQNPGVEEEAQGQSYVGRTGAVMDGVYLKLAGLVRSEINVTNALRCRWNHTNDLPSVNSVVVKEAVKHCRVYDRSQSRVVVTQGDYALLAHAGETSSTVWRGWALPHREALGSSTHVWSWIWTPTPKERVVYSTVHLARLFHEPSLTLTTKRDWAKIPRLVVGAWPKKLGDLTEIRYDPPSFWPLIFSFDTEYIPETGRLVRYSMTDEKFPGSLRTWVVEASDHQRPALPSPGLDFRCTVITQNGPVDYYHLAELAGTPEPGTWALFEDTMYLHSVLYPGKVSEPGDKSPPGVSHDLDYLGSLYAPINRWKHLDSLAPLEYSAADALGTWFVFHELLKEAARDPLSLKVYQEQKRPLIPMIAKAQRNGLRTWQPRVEEVTRDLEEQARLGTLRLQAAAGWPINPASIPQVGHQLYKVEGHPVPRRRKK